MGSIEREVKLSADAGFRMPDLAAVSDGAEVRARPVERLRATYYDTTDLRLIRAGITARHRVEGDDKDVWTLKLPLGASGSESVRNELKWEAGPQAIPAELSDLVRAHIRRSTLAPVARLTTVRRALDVLDGEARLLEVADDEVSVYQGRRLAARFRELEVEVVGPVERRLLDDIVSALVDAGAERGQPRPKVVRALGLRALDPPEAAPPALGVDSSIDDAVAAAISAGVTRLLRSDPAMRLGDDPEDLHQVRVAIRRLRSDVRTFRTVVDPEWMERINPELRWIGGLLGEVRDADVLGERFARQADALPADDRGYAIALLDRLRQQRSASWANLTEAVGSNRYVGLVESLVLAAEYPPVTEDATVAASKILPTMVKRPWRHFERAVAAADDKDHALLHEVRIRAKRARYAAEAAAPVCGKPARRLAEALAGVQEVLGGLQDAVTAEQWLRAAAQDCPPAAVLAAGELIAVQRRDMDDAVAKWRSAAAKATSKKLRSWLDG